MSFKTIDEAVKFISDHRKPGDSRALRTIAFAITKSTDTNDIIAAILGTLSEFQFKSSGEEELSMTPGDYEAVIVVHIRAIEPTDAPPPSGIEPELPS